MGYEPPRAVEHSAHNTSSLSGMMPISVRITRWAPSTNGYTDFGGLTSFPSKFKPGYFTSPCSIPGCTSCGIGGRNFLHEERNFSSFSEFRVSGEKRLFMHDPVGARGEQGLRLRSISRTASEPRVLLVLSHDPNSFLQTKTGNQGLSRKIIAAIVDAEWYDGINAMPALLDDARLGMDSRSGRAVANGACPFSANPFPSAGLGISDAEKIFNFHVEKRNVFRPPNGLEPTLGQLLAVARRGRNSRVEFSVGSLRLRIRTSLLWRASKERRWMRHII